MGISIVRKECSNMIAAGEVLLLSGWFKQWLSDNCKAARTTKTALLKQLDKFKCSIDRVYTRNATPSTMDCKVMSVYADNMFLDMSLLGGMQFFAGVEGLINSYAQDRVLLTRFVKDVESMASAMCNTSIANARNIRLQRWEESRRLV